jgi:CO dehydrogenase/acetyl-CoA synthase delta subunit
LGSHDGKRDDDKIPYEKEEEMLRGIKILLKSSNTDSDFEKCARVPTKAKEYYDVLKKIASAKSIGNIESR